MKPISFTESNKTLHKPNSMSDEQCGTLPVFTDDNECISKWRMSFKERIHCLLKGFVWVRVWSGITQPPILVTARKTEFEDLGGTNAKIR